MVLSVSCMLQLFITTFTFFSIHKLMHVVSSVINIIIDVNDAPTENCVN